MASHQHYDKNMLSETMLLEDLLLYIAFLVVKKTRSINSSSDCLAPTTKRKKLELMGLDLKTELNSPKPS